MDNTNKNGVLEELYNIIQKAAKGRKKNSYTKSLIKKVQNQIARKVGEESVELITDYLKGSKKRVIEEASDLIYHLIVLLYSKKITIKQIKEELKKRKNVRRG